MVGETTNAVVTRKAKDGGIPLVSEGILYFHGNWMRRPRERPLNHKGNPSTFLHLKGPPRPLRNNDETRRWMGIDGPRAGRIPGIIHKCRI